MAARATHQQRHDQMHAVARHHASLEVCGVLDRRGVGCEHDVSEQRDLCMPHGRAVDDADHRRLDVEQVDEQMLRFPVDRIVDRGRHRIAVLMHAGRNGRSAEGIARAGHDHDLVVPIASYIEKSLLELAMGCQIPYQWLAVRVEVHLQYAIGTCHADGLEFV